MTKSLDDSGLDLIFRQARTYNGWQARDIPDDVVHQLWETLKWGPTSFNCLPARFVFVRSEAAKARLAPHMLDSNAAKMRKAPLCVIVAYDSRFQDFLPQTFPAYDAKPLFDGNPALAETTAKRNGSLQGAYLIIAARALGLDCGPMSGFNAEAVDAEFFPDGRWKANFLCNLGYGTEEGLYPRSPRLEFDQACRIL